MGMRMRMRMGMRMRMRMQGENGACSLRKKRLESGWACRK
ncbi:hypothetical protein B2K_40345 [Paenibacillus mucilaginosus K02]|uniref:Uncharacterized protein n=1 Tax=Paenibacillus mucilaginosus K02 TaxID=997761 RepID=R9UNI2_9BACL|nr:hypothetical protein B2K_40345 [Paenibacillus mucilaginosus K02]